MPSNKTNKEEIIHGYLDGAVTRKNVTTYRFNPVVATALDRGIYFYAKLFGVTYSIRLAICSVYEFFIVARQGLVLRLESDGVFECIVFRLLVSGLVVRQSTNGTTFANTIIQKTK